MVRSDDERFGYNRAAWDERVALHVASDFYDNASFLAGRSSLRDYELEDVGEVSGTELCHLQCHFGQDTLSWARLGAKVVGLDFSGEAVVAATALAAEAGLDAEFLQGNVYDAVEVLDQREFDIVYTGLGALVWLPDLAKWAEVVSDLLRPGGFLYLTEMHPFTDVFTWQELVVANDYFADPAGIRSDDTGSYVDHDAETKHNTTFEWVHPLSEVIGALLAAGLRLDAFRELDFTVFARWPFLERRDDFTWHLPADLPRLPLLYSLRASKPA